MTRKHYSNCVIVTVNKAKNNLTRCLAAVKRGESVVIIQNGERYELRSVSPPVDLPRYTSTEVDAALDLRSLRLLNRAAKASR